MDVLRILEEIKPSLPATRKQKLKELLAHYLNELIQHDFAALVQVLYRVDVPEKKLKMVLQERTGEDAGNILAELLIQRQEEKRAMTNSLNISPEDSEEERW